MMKLMRDKPNLSLGEMLKELKGWLDQLDDLKPAATRRSQEKQIAPKKASANLTETSVGKGCNWWKRNGHCKYGDQCHFTHEAKNKGPHLGQGAAETEAIALFSNFNPPTNPPSTNKKPSTGYACFKCGSPDHY